MKLDAARLSGAKTVLAAHQEGGVSLWGRSAPGGEWMDLEFMLEADDQGVVTITAFGIYDSGNYGAVTDPAVFERVLRPAEPDPTPTPQPTAAPTPHRYAPAHTSTNANASTGPGPDCHGAVHGNAGPPADGSADRGASDVNAGPTADRDSAAGSNGHQGARTRGPRNAARTAAGGIRGYAVVADHNDDSRRGDVGNRRGPVRLARAAPVPLVARRECEEPAGEVSPMRVSARPGLMAALK